MSEVASSSEMIVFVMIVLMTQSINESDGCIDRQNCPSIDCTCTASRGKKTGFQCVKLSSLQTHCMQSVDCRSHNTTFIACVFLSSCFSVFVDIF